METWIKRIALIFAVFGGTVLATIIAGRAVMPAFGLEFNLDYARMAGWALSPISIWLYVRTWERGDSGSVMLGAPRQLISLGSSLRWTFGMALVIGLGIFALQSVSKNTEVVRPPGARAFHEANLLITSSRKGIQHGNTPKAKQLAGEFASRLKMARHQGIEARKSAVVISASGGEFLTYCHMTDDHCVFLVHVPDLRNFTPSAKDYIAEAALTTALNLTAKSGIKPAAVAVGIRGALFYDRALSVALEGGSRISSVPTDQVEGNDECESFLGGYFAPSTASTTANQSTAAAPVSVSASRVGVVSR